MLARQDETRTDGEMRESCARGVWMQRWLAALGLSMASPWGEGDGPSELGYLEYEGGNGINNWKNRASRVVMQCDWRDAR